MLASSSWFALLRTSWLRCVVERVKMSHVELRAAKDVVYIVERGVLDQAAIAAFTFGQCHGMALALHERTNWPLVATYNVAGIPQHVLADARDGRLVDITGARSAAELLTADNVEAVKTIDRAEVDRFVTDERWAVPDTDAAQFWLDEVIERWARDGEAMALRPLGRGVPVDPELELVFRWDGTQHIEVLLRRPGEPQAVWVEWRCFRVPPDDDGLRRVRFTETEFERLCDLWLSQQFDADDARVALRAACAGGP